jgi:hypothetical protein
MPTPKGKRAEAKVRRAVSTKSTGRTSKPTSRATKPALGKRQAATLGKTTGAKTAARPAPTTPKHAAPRVAAPVPQAAQPITRLEKKEATSMADTCPIHGVPDCFKPALDGFVRQAYAGYCTKIDWPFVRIIPKGWKPGRTLQDLLAEKAAMTSTVSRETVAAGVTAAVVKAAKVEFYYSSKLEPAKNFFCDNKKALDLCGQLKSKGVTVVAQDCTTHPVPFATYNAAVTGPSAAKRAVFGAKGALEEDMGKTVPALLVYAKTDDKYPVEVFPRTDKDLGRLVGVEEALQLLIKNA